jgi:hypothetical protein
MSTDDPLMSQVERFADMYQILPDWMPLSRITQRTGKEKLDITPTIARWLKMFDCKPLLNYLGDADFNRIVVDNGEHDSSVVTHLRVQVYKPESSVDATERWSIMLTKMMILLACAAVGCTVKEISFKNHPSHLVLRLCNSKYEKTSIYERRESSLYEMVVVSYSSYESLESLFRKGIRPETGRLYLLPRVVEISREFRVDNMDSVSAYWDPFECRKLNAFCNDKSIYGYKVLDSIRSLAINGKELSSPLSGKDFAEIVKASVQSTRRDGNSENRALLDSTPDDWASIPDMSEFSSKKLVQFQNPTQFNVYPEHPKGFNSVRDMEPIDW